MSRAIELALKTWYPEDHPLHNDLHHPLGKLVGEWGELLDDYMKHLYKPGYEWQPIDELVDIWYYIRILAYQLDVELVAIPLVATMALEHTITSAIVGIAQQFNQLCRSREYNLDWVDTDILTFRLTSNYSVLSHLCNKFDITIDDLTRASWDKLKPGSERGEEWMKAREVV